VGWDVREPLHVACNGDRVLSRVRGALLRAARELDADDAREPGRAAIPVAGRAAGR
jgi:hypothetical protein